MAVPPASSAPALAANARIPPQITAPSSSRSLQSAATPTALPPFVPAAVLGTPPAMLSGTRKIAATPPQGTNAGAGAMDISPAPAAAGVYAAMHTQLQHSTTPSGIITRTPSSNSRAGPLAGSVQHTLGTQQQQHHQAAPASSAPQGSPYVSILCAGVALCALGQQHAFFPRTCLGWKGPSHDPTPHTHTHTHTYTHTHTHAHTHTHIFSILTNVQLNASLFTLVLNK